MRTQEFARLMNIQHFHFCNEHKQIYRNLNSSSYSSKTLRIHLLPTLSPNKKNSPHTSLSMSTKYKGKELIFIRKRNISHEPKILKLQYKKNTVIINVRTDADIRIIDTRIGGTYFHNNQLMFILVPRKESITMKSPKMFIKGLAAMEKRKPCKSSDRGTLNRVLFENKDSNYINLGIGVSRGTTGLYIRELKNQTEQDVIRMKNGFSHTKHICERYIPKAFIKALNIGMDVTNMQYFNMLLSYKEILILNKKKMKPTKTTEVPMNGKQH